MDYIVLDMEWNQPYSKTKKHPYGVALSGEIIQIGAIRMDSEFNTVDTFKADIKPAFYRKINRHVTDITGLTEKSFKGCLGFKSVYREFEKFCGDDYCILTWGSDDIPMLCDNMRAHGICKKEPHWCNLQILFNVQVSHEYRQWSLSDALDKLNIERISVEHDAFCDAQNTARLVSHLDMSEGVERYRTLEFMTGKNTELEMKCGFKSVKQALSDKSLLKVCCPVCSGKLKILSKKKLPSSRMIETRCDKHGEFRFRITVTHNEDDYIAHKKVGIINKQLTVC